MLSLVFRGTVVCLSVGFVAGVAGCGSQGTTFSFPDATATGPTSPTKTKDSGSNILKSSSDSSACGGSSGDQQGCPCTLGQTVGCYTGPAGTVGVGSCQAGAQRCQAAGEFPVYGACMGQVLPSSPTACVVGHDASVPVDAGPPPVKDAGVPPVKDAAPPPQDANPIAVVIGAPCTPGQTEMGPGSYPCTGSIGECSCGPGTCSCSCTDGGMASTMTSVYFCDTAGIWDQFPAGTCQAPACASCMQTNCESIVAMGGTGTACAMGLQQAVNWLAACGPDRANIFQTFGAACSGTLLQQVEECKDEYCTGTGICSFW